MKYNKNRKFVGKMFDDISPSYDRMNHIMSGFQDLRWRKKAVKYLASAGSDYKNILDLASGSGDFGREFMKLEPEKLFSVDLSIEMLKINSAKLKFENNLQVKSDAESLPFRDGFFDVCGIGFGIRNFERLDACLSEINRVLKKNGRLVVIEMFKPAEKSIFDKSFKLYFEKIMPKIGSKLSGSDYAYDYLFESVAGFLGVDEFSALAEKRGYRLEKVTRNFSKVVYTVFLQKN